VISGGQTTQVTLRRNEPYASGIQLRLGDASGPELSAGSVIAVDQPVWIGIWVTNATTFPQTSRVEVVLKRDTDAVPLIDTGESSSAEIAGGGSGLFEFLVTPTEPGRYFLALQVRTFTYLAFTKTDAWDWVERFSAATAGTELANGVPVQNIEGALWGSYVYYYLDVPVGASGLTFSISGVPATLISTCDAIACRPTARLTAVPKRKATRARVRSLCPHRGVGGSPFGPLSHTLD